jgi:5-methylcytosine-specific restriction protein A
MVRSLEGENFQGACCIGTDVRHMPKKPKHPCAYGSCPKLTDRRYCPEHERLKNHNYEKYGRDKDSKRRYGRAWKRIRNKYAAEHPFCELCYERGVLVPTEEIHHKLPLSEGGTHDQSNLIALCKSCHSQIHAKRGDRWHDR